MTRAVRTIRSVELHLLRRRARQPLPGLSARRQQLVQLGLEEMTASVKIRADRHVPGPKEATGGPGCVGCVSLGAADGEGVDVGVEVTVDGTSSGWSVVPPPPGDWATSFKAGAVSAGAADTPSPGETEL